MRKKEKEEIKRNGPGKKPPLKVEKISCDDFEVEVDGETYHPHLDEWVEVLPIRRLDELKNLMELASFEAGENLTMTDPRLMAQYEGICKYLSDTIHRWNFTNEDDEEYPRPYKNPRVVEALTLDEINYLVSKLIGGRTDEGKDDSQELPDTSKTEESLPSSSS